MSGFDAMVKLRAEYKAGNGSMDVTFKVEEELISVHKKLIALSSDAFSAQFYGELDSGEKDGVVVVEDGTARGFKNFMGRIYGVELQATNDPRLLMESLYFAKKYQIGGIGQCLAEELMDLASLKETALETIIVAYLYKGWDTFERLCQRLRSRGAITLHVGMESFMEVYKIGDKLKDNPEILSYVMEEMAGVQEENTREKEAKAKDDEILSLKNSKENEIQTLEKKIKDLSIGNCINCDQPKAECKDGKAVEIPKIGIRVQYNRYKVGYITSYHVNSVDVNTRRFDFFATCASDSYNIGNIRLEWSWHKGTVETVEKSSNTSLKYKCSQ